MCVMVLVTPRRPVPAMAAIMGGGSLKERAAAFRSAGR